MEDNNRQSRRSRYLNWNTGGLNLPQVLFLIIFFYCTLFFHVLQLAYSYLMGKVWNKSDGLIVYSNERPKSTKLGETSGAGSSSSNSRKSNPREAPKEKKFGDSKSKEDVKKKEKIPPNDVEF